MKKVFVTLFCLILIIMSLSSVSAESLDVEFSCDSVQVQQGESFSLPIKAKGEKICAVAIDFYFDSSIITVDSSEWLISDFAINDANVNVTKTEDGDLITIVAQTLGKNISLNDNIASFSITANDNAEFVVSTVRVVPVVQYIDENNKYVNIPCEPIEVTIEIICPHENTTEVPESPATCVDIGYTAGVYCNDCGKYISGHEEIEVDPDNHVGRTYIKDDKAPTCTENGYTGDTYCSSCNKLIKSGEEIPALGHKWNDGEVTVEPTCTEKGIKILTCTVCQEIMTEEIDALGHDWSEWITVVEPTEESTGLKQRTCNRCSEKEEEIIPELDHVHDYSYDVTVIEPTCTEGGYTLHTCRCGESIKDTEIAALGHDYQKETIPATCTETGKTVYTCTRCGDSYEETIAVLGHTWVINKVITEPTCTEAGEVEYICSVCGETEIRESETFGHEFGAWEAVDEKTHTHICAICGTEESEEHISTGWIIDKAATATSEGLRHKECTVCKYVLEEEIIEATGSENDDYNKLYYDLWYYAMYMNRNKSYKITASASEGGTISNEGTTDVKKGSDITYTITPDKNYTIESVVVNGKDQGAINKYTFVNVQSNQTISVTFVKTDETTEVIQVSDTPTEAIWKNPFADVNNDSPYIDAIQFVYENGLFKGTTETTFSPEVTMNRGMFVTVLGRLAGIDADKYMSVPVSFDDVGTDLYYTPYVLWASENGIVNGYGNGLFMPEKEITIEEAAVIIARYANYIGIDITANNVIENYADGEAVSIWATDAMNWVLEKGIYEAGIELKPQEKAARALVAIMLYNFAK